MPMLASAMSGLPGMAGGSAGFSMKSVMRSVRPRASRRSRVAMRARHLDAAHCHVGALLDMLCSICS